MTGHGPQPDHLATHYLISEERDVYSDSYVTSPYCALTQTYVIWFINDKAS
jgi:hypothetical protein